MNRRLSSEAEVIIAPFIGKSYQVRFTFITQSRTFLGKHTGGFEEGKTVVANFADGDLECSVLISEEENEWVETLRKDEEFECRVDVLALDSLYQRIIFGKYLGDPDEEQLGRSNEAIPVESGSSGIGRVDTAPIKDLIFEEKEDEKTAAEPVSEKELESFETSIPIVELQDEKEPEVQEFVKEDISTIMIEPEDKVRIDSGDVVGKDSSEDLNGEDAEEGEPPLLPFPREAQNEYGGDNLDLEQILDKRYNSGFDSLTEGERAILKKNKKPRRTFTVPDRRNKKVEETTHSNADNLALGCRTLMAIPFAYLGLKSLDEGFFVMLFGLGFLFIAYKLAEPMIRQIKKNYEKNK
jgi:hypothetical protein